MSVEITIRCDYDGCDRSTAARFGTGGWIGDIGPVWRDEGEEEPERSSFGVDTSVILAEIGWRSSGDQHLCPDHAPGSEWAG